MSKYRTIVADPPWDVKRPTGWSTNQNHQEQPYPVMTTDDISALPVGDLAADSAVLFLWTVNRYIEQSYNISRAWGFRPVQLLTWCKPPLPARLGGWFTPSTEFILFARKGTLPDGRAHHVASTWFQWPRYGQSEKPEAFLDMVEAFTPEPRIELFARRNRLGWDTWGNESLEMVDL